jgi:preprotein translocase subunit SecG
MIWIIEALTIIALALIVVILVQKVIEDLGQ